MIERIKVRNFKSFVEAELRLRPLTVMVGANASGKTNFIEAIGLLGWMAGGQPLSHVYSAARDGELPLRGAQRLTRFGNEQPIGFEVDAGGVRLELEAAFGGASSQIVRERMVRLEPGASVVYESAVRPTSKARSSTRFLAPKLVVMETERDRPVFVHALPHDLVDPDIDVFRIALANASVFRPVPEVMRGYAASEDWRELRPDGANLSAVVDNLCQGGYRDELLAFIRALPEQDIQEIGFIRVPGRSDIMLQLRESFGGKENWQEAALLSDGTLRALGIAAALFSNHWLLVVEDIDDGIHPARIGGMLEAIRQHAERFDLKVLVTTHNPALLDALPDEELGHVVACYRDPDQGDSRLIELGDLHEFPALVAQGPLGQLMTEGLLDRALKRDRTAEQRATDALEWLGELEAGE